MGTNQQALVMKKGSQRLPSRRERGGFIIIIIIIIKYDKMSSRRERSDKDNQA